MAYPVPLDSIFFNPAAYSSAVPMAAQTSKAEGSTPSLATQSKSPSLASRTIENIKDWFKTHKKELTVAGKVFLVALVIAGLIAATVFTGGAAAAAFGMGIVAWKIGILIGGTAILGLSTLASFALAIKHDMFIYRTNGKNAEGAVFFTLESLFFVGRAFWELCKIMAFFACLEAITRR